MRGYYRVLRTILVAAGAEDACRNVGTIKLAPIGDVVKKAEPKRGNYLTRDELRLVLAHIEKQAPQWYAAVLLDVFVGLRWGELSALRWSDIDEQRGVIRVDLTSLTDPAVTADMAIFANIGDDEVHF